MIISMGYDATGTIRIVGDESNAVHAALDIERLGLLYDKHRSPFTIDRPLPAGPDILSRILFYGGFAPNESGSDVEIEGTFAGKWSFLPQIVIQYLQACGYVVETSFVGEDGLEWDTQTVSLLS